MTDILSSITAQTPSRKRLRRAASPGAAIARQSALAARDSSTLYDFTVAAYPLTRAVPVFRKSTAASRAVSPPSSPERAALVAQTQQMVELLNTTIADSARQLTTLSTKLRETLTRDRLAVFCLDFAARKRFPLSHGACVLCDKKRLVTQLPCCARADNPKLLCCSCLERSAFHTSAHGTQASARCSFCDAAYPVYDKAALAPPKRKRTDDE